jgi:hypothetical protein
MTGIEFGFLVGRQGMHQENRIAVDASAIRNADK